MNETSHAQHDHSPIDGQIDPTPSPPVTPQEWESWYAKRDRIWSGNPNGTFTVLVTGLTPATALDVGCGEGADAVWLAERGWTVTATDVSPTALARAEKAAATQGLTIDWRVADALTGLPTGFELVSLQYPAIPKDEDGRGIASLLASVAPGGRLVMVGHELEHRPETGGFNPDDYVQVHDVVAALDATEWEILLHEIRPRPGGHIHENAEHHQRDAALMARRLA